MIDMVYSFALLAAAWADLKSREISLFLCLVMWLVVHLRSILGVRNKVIVLLNWVWNYFTYDQSMRMIVYARKAKEIRDREKLEETTHWGKEQVQEEKDLSITSSSK